MSEGLFSQQISKLFILEFTAVKQPLNLCCYSLDWELLTKSIQKGWQTKFHEQISHFKRFKCFWLLTWRVAPHVLQMSCEPVLSVLKPNVPVGLGFLLHIWINILTASLLVISVIVSSLWSGLRTVTDANIRSWCKDWTDWFWLTVTGTKHGLNVSNCYKCINWAVTLKMNYNTSLKRSN